MALDKNGIAQRIALELKHNTYVNLEQIFKESEIEYTEKYYEYKSCLIKKKHLYKNIQESLKHTKEAKSILV